MENASDDAKETDCVREDLDDKDLDEERRVLRIRERRTRTHNTDRDARDEIAQADCQTGAEHHVACGERERERDEHLSVCASHFNNRYVPDMRFFAKPSQSLLARLKS